MTTRPRREITGRQVLLCLVAFFGLIAAMNAVLITVAVSTFGGVETESSYKAGLMFAKEMSAARAQDSLHWRVQAVVTPKSDGQQVELQAYDAGGRPLSGLSALVRLSHPTDRRADIAVDLSETSPGRYVGTAAAAAGQWDLIIELARNDERVFRSKNRLVIKPR
jgi:nitrogen fixation protein FixH